MRARNERLHAVQKILNSMKSANRYKWIALLMLVSELMIVGFSIYWLRSQYQKESNDLRKDLYTYYKESYNVAIDSLLVHHIIEPALGEKGGLNVRLKISGKPDSAVQDSEYSFIKSRDSVLLRSMRLIIEKSSDSTSNTRSVVSLIGEGPDSLLFIEDYEARLNNNKMNFTTIWFEDDSISEAHRAIILEDWTGSLPSVLIRNPGFYLIGQILPQMIFTLILVLISSLAFLLAFNSLRKQSKLNDMRNSFISNISHELKTPVSTVKIAIEALKKLDSEEGNTKITTEYLEMAGKEIKRLELLISKVLDHSIIEENASILNFDDVDISQLIEDAIKSLQPRIQASDAKVIFDNPGEIIVSCDPLYLQGVIINLFDNSLKYGNGNPLITVDLSSAGSYAVIKVSDNGPGIPDEYLGRVFDKFFRVPDSDLHNVKGHGLGLSFAYLIVKMHGGSIDVKNNTKGCTFTIKIPFRQE